MERSLQVPLLRTERRRRTVRIKVRSDDGWKYFQQSEKGVETRRLANLGDEVETKACVVIQVVKSRVKWARHNGQNEIRWIAEKI